MGSVYHQNQRLSDKVDTGTLSLYDIYPYDTHQ